MTAPATDDVAPGHVLAGRYRVESILGAGGFGTVVAATDLELGREVAVKLLARERLGSAEARERLRREARALARLDDPRLVRIHDVGELADGRPYLTMERLHGHDLAVELAGRDRLPVAEATAILIEVCAGLGVAHAHGIVHRDLKPQNLFLATTGDGARRVRVLDFGVARIPTSPALTASDAWIGSPRYMAPEQLVDPGSVDARTDVWALGVILQELVTGAPIFDAVSPAAYASKILTARPVALRTRDPSLPAALEAIVARCLQPSPAERFPGVAALAAALGALAATTGGATARAAATPGPRRRPGRGWLVVTALVAAGVIAVVAYRAGRRVSRGAAAAEAAEPPRLATPSAPAPPGSTPSPPAVSAAAVPPAPAAGAPDPVRAGAVPSGAATGEAPPPPARSRRRSPTAATAAAATGPVAADALAVLCREQGNASPYFLVPGNDGPIDQQCARLAGLGCTGLDRRCRSERDAGRRQRCREFVDVALARGACPR